MLKAIEGFISLGITLHPLTFLFQKVLDYTERFNISAYDAAYVALADTLQVQFVTADKRLFDSARKLNFIKWIGQFRV
ncbi:MAG: type II toxin-antitoxin system VapC family toxin [Candidatus Lindowbacteria bacterium]|nr:type II toxin-antitoxin system VapC family toxin [Candidatus Lindowbacteria bacterium]